MREEYLNQPYIDDLIRRAYEKMGTPSQCMTHTTSAATTNEGASMAAPTLNLYEVLIIDSRITDDQDAVQSVFVRSTSSEDAKLRALLRSQYDERDINYLDVVTRSVTLIGVKPVADDDEDDD